MCEESDDIVFTNTLTGALIDYDFAMGDAAAARRLMKTYLDTLSVGPGLWYVLPAILTILAGRATSGEPLPYARLWTQQENNLGSLFLLLLDAKKALLEGRLSDASALAARAIPNLERLKFETTYPPGQKMMGGDVFTDTRELFQYTIADERTTDV